MRPHVAYGGGGYYRPHVMGPHYYGGRSDDASLVLARLVRADCRSPNAKARAVRAFCFLGIMLSCGITL